MSKIVFYCNDSKSNLEIFEYYKQDIDALRALGHQLVICTKYREIPARFDLMFVWWWTYALWPVLLSRLRGKPCIITGTFNFRFPEGFDGRDYFRRPLWQRLLLKMAAKLCSLNLFVNRVELEGCSKYFSLKNGCYYPHIINDDYLQGPAAERKKVLFNLAWAGKQNLIRKGIPELLQAVRLLKDDGIKIHLNLAGREGNGMDYLREMIDNLDIKGQVSHLGMISREDKIKMLRECEVYVQPSHYEGFGVAIAEAMGCGACIITCDAGAVREVVGDCGIYVPQSSPEKLAEAIKRVMQDDELRIDFQDKARKRISECFSSGTKLKKLKKYLSVTNVL